MDEADPHIHVDARLRGEVAQRNILASTFGLVADAPTTVTTGCGRRVPLAMTSVRPEAVTCLACREFGHQRHLRFAEQMEQLSRMPGIVVSHDETMRLAAWHREFAQRFGGRKNP